ncbi:hypothetical protein, partial [Actinomadura rudentiformis]|uniref:hypothetical protein n=1 Tax=Actinomadura rudentiformis TaxID=359158 RepID=UPI001CEF615E
QRDRHDPRMEGRVERTFAALRRPHHPELTAITTPPTDFQTVPVLSSRWNYYHPTAGGKTVWCELTDDVLPMKIDSP